MRHRRSYIGIAGFLVVIGLAAGSLRSHGSQAASPPPDDRIAYTSDLSHRVAIAPGVSAADVLASVAQRANPSHLVAASLGAPPQVPGVRSGAWLHFVVAIPAEGEQTSRPQWEADLVEGAVAERLANGSLGAGPVVGSTTDWRLPDGSILPNMSDGMGDIVPGQNFSTATDAAIKADLTAELNSANLTPISIDVLHIDQAAPAVVAQTTDPSAAAKAASTTIRDLFGQNPAKYEGYYFEIRDPSGHPVLSQSASFRSGIGRSWTDPSLADVSSLDHVHYVGG